MMLEEIELDFCSKALSSYCKNLNPLNILPKEAGCEIFCLLIPILMVFIMWTVGLILVLIIPPFMILVGFAMWVMFWPVVIFLPPTLYFAGKNSSKSTQIKIIVMG